MHEFCMTGKSEDTLVVCRLRKNCEFHINDKSRKKSLNKRKPSAVDNFATSSTVEQIGWLDQVGDCRPKEGSCSLNSHYTEQTDSGHESDDKMHGKLFQHNIMLQKSEEDCFADIMKDDIIKLDDSSSAFGMDSELLPAVVHECEMKINLKRPAQAIASRVIPSQGTANRRVRLNKLNEEDPQPNQEQNRPAQENDVSISQRFFKSSPCRTKHLVVYWCLAIVIILVMSINLLKGYSLREAASSAYQNVCAPYHTWSIRTAVFAGMCTLPTKAQLVINLNETDESTEKHMRRFIDASLPVIKYIDNLYILRGITLDW